MSVEPAVPRDADETAGPADAQGSELPVDPSGAVVGAWLPATLASTEPLSGSGRTLRLLVPGLREAAAGQHVDVRLTADDGYQAVRSYSLSDVRASAGGPGRVPEIELAVERLDDGEVSPYLVDAMEVGDPLEVRGPIGGWFRWPPTRFGPGSAVQAVMPDPLGAAPVDASPVQLVAGGSGVAPLVSMLRVRAALAEGPEFRLLHSVRDAASRWFAAELDAYAAAGVAEVTTLFTRAAPAGGGRAPGRLTERELLDVALPAERHPVVYVCGTNGFVARVAEWLVAAGHDPTRVRTERFGGL
ncbi:FAD-binding oxidoreductase [Frigoribacterium salinisoli]